ncbi:MAG: trans-2-enoyl-CoA reductase family protein [Acidobacteria bacterium]|nr:trans-2-enoyl-CoA reductase family protein [Acidobacteriota bacterium]
MAIQVVQERTRGFICITAHPEGCRRRVEEQVATLRQSAPAPLEGPKTVLVIGASTGYGLSTRIAAAWGFGAKTVGVFLERLPESRRTASAGYYNSAAFHKLAAADGLYAGSINGDAFSEETKRDTVQLVKKELGKIDLVVYSVAAPRRIHPETGDTVSSVLKPIGNNYTGKTIDLSTGSITEVAMEPADEDEIVATVSVMGGEDWQMWMDLLGAENLLAEGVRTLAYSYVGPEVTWPIYRDGTIGMAKKDLVQTGHFLNDALAAEYGGGAWVSVNKAVVTQASAAIPVVPLYLSLLFRVMKQKGLHEGCIEQMRRLCLDHLAAGKEVRVDKQRLIRLDDLELRDDVQDEVAVLWDQVNTENLNEISDYQTFRKEFSRLFGFEVAGINYDEPVEVDVRL